MGLIRLLLLLFVAWLIWSMIRPLFRQDSTPRRQGNKGQVENMVRCAHCGLNLPEQESIHEGDDFFCSEEHRRLGPRRK